MIRQYTRQRKAHSSALPARLLTLIAWVCMTYNCRHVSESLDKNFMALHSSAPYLVTCVTDRPERPEQLSLQERACGAPSGVVVHVALDIALRLVNPLVSVFLVPAAEVAGDLRPGMRQACRRPTQPAEGLQSTETGSQKSRRAAQTNQWLLSAPSSANDTIFKSSLSIAMKSADYQLSGKYFSHHGRIEETEARHAMCACLLMVMHQGENGQHTCRQTHCTRLHPPFFSTGLPHFGQGLVFAVSQFFVSLSSWHFCFQCFHLHMLPQLCLLTLHIHARCQISETSLDRWKGQERNAASEGSNAVQQHQLGNVALQLL